MRVNPNNIYGPSTAGAQGTSRSEGSYGSRGAGAYDSGSVDSADISQIASVATRVISKDQSARAERVAALRNQWESGSYAVDAAALSRSMVSDMLTSGAQR